MLLIALAVPCTVLAIALLGALRVTVRGYTRLLLGRREAQEVRSGELLAERVGDRTLSIAYWLEGRRRSPTSTAGGGLPGSGRTWTAVEHEGRRVAAIIHDADLDATPELVNAAAAAAALALDNERLKADLRARVVDLRISRAASSRPPTRPAAGSSATSTTAPSSSSWRSRWTCACCAPG